MASSTEGTRRGRGTARSATADEAEEANAGPDALDLSGLNAVVGYALRRAQLAVFEDFIARFATLDLTPAQYSVLLVIGNNPGRKQAEIAAALGIQRPNFVNMLDELERRGLAERLPSATDRRSHALVLTKSGSALLARARAMQDEQERELAQKLGPGGREMLVALLQRLM
ncbi:MarR family winged helix-turn-helix transcriptional regulator [Blastochloris tepida]|uniref:Transcriptional regulator n=1 Tax=Blastochloris tepida TaxID=2233851 RepID=A0A348G064_9HYPH|nr:MarR family transcriptional regulator [Blastochloris tepida]BBF92947.1 transcriptional regulator [Blastochloris tepida]